MAAPLFSFLLRLERRTAPRLPRTVVIFQFSIENRRGERMTVSGCAIFAGRLQQMIP